MSLFSALNTAVSGLSAQEWAIGNISNNIANSQTTGYKGIDTSFESLVYANGKFQQPESVAAQSVYTNNVSGSIVQSQQATSLAINGAGFFEVKGPATSTTSGVSSFDATNYYSRRGDFMPNQYGYLVNGAGYTLEGYPVNSTTGQVTGSTSQPIQIPSTDATPTPTSLMTVISSLPSSYPIQGASNYTSPAPVSETIYDALGAPHTVTIQFDHTAANTWQASISSPDDTSSGTGGPTTTVVALNFSGTTTGTDQAGTLQSITSVSGSGTVTATQTAGSAATITLPFAFANGAQSVSLNLGNFQSTTGTVDTGSDSTVDTTTKTQDGSAAGTLTGLAIDDNGYVNLTYSNGQTVKAYQVAVAQFNAPDQLQSIDGSTFAQTEDSGAAIITAPGQQGAGTISPSALEQSNVNLSSELTKLIVAQQTYSSNAKVITTANQMLQTVTNLIQG